MMFRDYGLMWGELRAQMEELREKQDSIQLGALIVVMDLIEYLEEVGDLEERE
mgnify:CR=1 FL=1